MSPETAALAATAASIGFFHTLFGPDHYLPFVALAKAGRWPLPKALAVAFFCGLAHVLSSVILGLVGLALGSAVFKLVAIESARGELAAWALILFGLTYMVWGLRKSRHSHPHEAEDARARTAWVLMIIFVLGPCEPLIPLLLYPAATGSKAGLFLVVGAFGAVTIATMLAAVAALLRGIEFARLPLSHRHAHALAGLTLFLCGAAIKFLGL